MALLQAYASSFNNAIPTGLTQQLTAPGNAQGAPDGVYASDAVAGVHSSGNHYYFADLASIPDTSTINSVTLVVRSHQTNAARGTYGYRLDSAPNAQIANEWAPAVQTATGVDQSNATWSAVPTLAQLKAATFGVRARYNRTSTQAITYNLDAIMVEVDYTPPGPTYKQSGGFANMVLGGTALITLGSGEPTYKPSGGADGSILVSGSNVLKIRRFGPVRP